ncbi:hypothetical protein CGCS363_v003662 [Colletotrichum siamense]|uniref:uncharacterized protein n=1 Tax=Colletotrichum siamense TaxID=690259 RepID=UPI0018722157|nr:uncharacterized protein CGCS363_v003662 [Colletotrichum siamense]KAF5510886.1 hypothetical protein CGCS363_v003662 [Colletotrichum siamense]
MPRWAQSIPSCISILRQNYEGSDRLDLHDDYTSLLPAVYRDAHENLNNPSVSENNILACIDKELNLKRLADVHNWLWLAGRPMPPRPLHYQDLLGRQIQVTEQMDMHLVWSKSKIWIKPLPRFLMEPRFWQDYLSCKPGPINGTHHIDRQPCSCRLRRQRALGFFFSYAALVSYESDFIIARDKHLVPMEFNWLTWRRFVKELLDNENIYRDIDPRFHYGELRLNRLNKLYYLWKTPLRAYRSYWNQYGSFFEGNFTWMASSTIYLVVVLTAMQVGLGTSMLKDNHAFQRASYGFTVFSILGPLIIAAGVVMVFVYLFMNNWVATLRFKRMRMRYIKHQVGNETEANGSLPPV